MKKLLVIALVALSLVACTPTSSVPEDSVRELCEYMVSTYPQATLQDVYKTCYQDFFGAEHLMQDTAAARAYLHYELNELRSERVNKLGIPMREPTGFRHRFERINLAMVLNGEMSEETLLQLFIDAAGKDNALHEHWADEWAEIEAIALQVQPAWQNDELQALLREAAAGNHAVHHSEAFRNTYNPHYRIIRL
ncbi:MAG: hypothetical protein J6P74_05665 [Paludibacteraceae bacterium]|nr:hypothetical protein [Paludibacteraceae bacterium]